MRGSRGNRERGRGEEDNRVEEAEEREGKRERGGRKGNTYLRHSNFPKPAAYQQVSASHLHPFSCAYLFKINKGKQGGRRGRKGEKGGRRGRRRGEVRRN